MFRPSLRLQLPRIEPRQAQPNPNPAPNTDPITATTTTTTITTTTAFISPLTPTLLSPLSIKSTHTTDTVGTMDNKNPTVTAASASAAAGGGGLSIHRGAIDHTTITTRPPQEVMTRVRDVLDSIGICVQTESMFRFRCVRPSANDNNNNNKSNDNNNSFMSVEAGSEQGTQLETSATTTTAIYAEDTSRDPAGEVRFSVELTRLAGLNDTYSLDIRRLKGNLRSYQFLYETIRDRAKLAA